MARTESNSELSLGTIAPAFELLDVRSNTVLSRDEIFASHPQGCPRLGLLVIFASVHCPFVQHVEDQLARIGRDFNGLAGEGPLAIVAINSNDTDAYPQDAPHFMRFQADRCSWSFPYLVDPSQEVARAYHAACTPDVYLFDRELKLAYHGQIDGTRPNKYADISDGKASDGADLRAAIQNMFARQPPLENQVPALGCNIKWRES
ncbi:thioredoxin family protein [Terriglobus saanensis]|uniref:Alkyl hydroperoxide reductase/ Thiol specific antioxidant/ Mal allergen n=1 Tax=Terriglobus saanensis (strain ATCC BAA-1853 / DSM 23119 / SP1PR4) TaxID=401053 RepID=E8V6B3_TERSS|nr:thioredoxin family protein [Terriglobus saanensis]ADV81578.1 alkyl hydroperoxide reductase/ Thiol specific antioxidant/ Mal allergen [Terriglobus saanensis SP1PR4]